jgi:hypothetical protein
MRSTIYSIALSLVLFAGTSAFAGEKEDLIQQAQELYSQRDYNAAGIASADQAAQKYAELLKIAVDDQERAQFSVERAQALYFVGSASEPRDIKLKYHTMGMEAAKVALKVFGITDTTQVNTEELKESLTPEQLSVAAEAIYQYGINLGQWGQANGVTQSLSRWPELRDTMITVNNLGKKDIHEYGPYRVLGRGYYKIPGLLGGDMAKAEKYLATAVSKSLAAGQVYSINGFNNTYYAEVLKEQGKRQQAIDLLKAYLTADPTTVNPDAVPESKEAQKNAKDLLKAWQR